LARYAEHPDKLKDSLATHDLQPCGNRNRRVPERQGGRSGGGSEFD
jgi:hypothetical protein